jgi:hypothetical protein
LDCDEAVGTRPHQDLTRGNREIKQLASICALLILVSGFLLLASGYSHAFVIHTDAYVEGNMSVDMGTTQSTGGQLNRYALEIDSTEGTTYVGNNFESGVTDVDIAYVANPDASMIGGSLSAEEEIGVNTCNSAECRLGVAGSTFDVKELSSSSKGNFSLGTYEITAQGVGKFGTNAGENASTSSPSVYEKNAYELDGEGKFDLLGKYGFRGNVEGESDPLSDALSQSGVTPQDSESQQHTLCISGPSSVTENSGASYTAAFDDETSQDITVTANWGEDSPYASIDSNGALSASDVHGDQTVTITAVLTADGETQRAEKQVTIVDTNAPPTKPVILSPYDGQTGCQLKPRITTEPFSDPETDSHRQTQWQISKNADFDPTILDMISTQQLTELTVPDMFLEADTLYYVRVRFYDAFLEPSAWSDTVEFATTGEISPFADYSLSVSGPSSVMENTTASYTALVTFADGTTETVTESASWGEDSSYASIDSNGVLSASGVIGDQTVTITAFYTYEGVMETAQTAITIMDSNLPPAKPVIVCPQNGQTGCEIQPTITTEPFSDPDNDSHGQTQWQISDNADFTATVFRITSTRQLTELKLLDVFLEPGRAYYVRVRFYDADLKPSEWSDTVTFTTMALANAIPVPGEPDLGNDQQLDGDDVALSDPDNTGNTMVAYDKGVAVDFGASGLWYYDGNDWTQLSRADPQWLCVYGDNLVGDYGSQGLWRFNGVRWSQLREDDPDNTGNTMVAYDTGVAVDFGTLGLWYYDGNDWTQLGAADPQWLCVYGDNLVGDYGSQGLWRFNGVSWSQLREDDPDNTGNTMVAYDTGVAVDFGTLGLWYFDGNDWTQLGAADPQWLCVYGDNLVGDYGSSGLWHYDGASWSHLGGADPDNTGNTMVAFNNGVAVDYETLGLWYYDGNDWAQLGDADPEWLCAYGDNLVGDYGSFQLQQDPTPQDSR